MLQQSTHTRGRQEAYGLLDEPTEASSSGRNLREAAERPIGSAVPIRTAGPEAFAVDVAWREDVATVQPRGELDVATVETLRTALDGIRGVGRLVLDLRGLSFIDSTGLHSLVALHRRAQREGFKLALVAPAAPVDKAIRLCGLDASLPFVASIDAGDP